MQAALKLNTTNLPGNRIEITTPELPEGTNVEVIVLHDLPISSLEIARPFKDVIAFLDSLTPVQRTPEEWAEIEREFQEDGTCISLQSHI